MIKAYKSAFIDRQRNFEETVFNFAVSKATADDRGPLSSRTSAVTVILLSGGDSSIFHLFRIFSALLAIMHVDIYLLWNSYGKAETMWTILLTWINFNPSVAG